MEIKKDKITKLSDFYHQLKRSLESVFYSSSEIKDAKQNYLKEFKKQIEESIDSLASNIRISIAESLS